MPGASFLTRYVVNSFTVPAGTVEASPLTATWDLGNVELEMIAVVIPSGHAGLTGFAVEYATTRIVPYSAGNDWIVSDDEDIPFEINAEIGNPLRLVGFNEDIYEHTFHLRAKVRSLEYGGAQFGAASAVVPL